MAKKSTKKTTKSNGTRVKPSPEGPPFRKNKDCIISVISTPVKLNSHISDDNY